MTRRPATGPPQRSGWDPKRYLSRLGTLASRQSPTLCGGNNRIRQSTVNRKKNPSLPVLCTPDERWCTSLPQSAAHLPTCYALFSSVCDYASKSRRKSCADARPTQSVRRGPLR